MASMGSANCKGFWGLNPLQRSGGKVLVHGIKGSHLEVYKISGNETKIQH